MITLKIVLFGCHSSSVLVSSRQRFCLLFCNKHLALLRYDTPSHSQPFYTAIILQNHHRDTLQPPVQLIFFWNPPIHLESSAVH